MKSGWILLFAVALLQTLGGVVQLIGNTAEVFESDTGVAWEELSDTYPTVARQFMITNQAALVAATAVGLLSLAVIYFGLREGQRWSWFALWVLPAYLIPPIISLARTDNQAWVAVVGGIFFVLAVAGLLISYRYVFPSSQALGES